MSNSSSYSSYWNTRFSCDSTETYGNYIELPSNVLPPANFHRSCRRRDEAVSKDEIQGTLAHGLDIIVQGDVGEHQLQLMSCQPAARAAHR